MRPPDLDAALAELDAELGGPASDYEPGVSPGDHDPDDEDD